MGTSAADAVSALMHAARWDLALALLDDTGDGGPDTELLRSDVVLDRAFWTRTPVPAGGPSAGIAGSRPFVLVASLPAG
jgi:hypothetical protein